MSAYRGEKNRVQRSKRRPRNHQNLTKVVAKSRRGDGERTWAGVKERDGESSSGQAMGHRLGTEDGGGKHWVLLGRKDRTGCSGGRGLGSPITLSHAQAREVPGVKIFRSSATIYFANAELYSDTLKQKVRLRSPGD